MNIANIKEIMQGITEPWSPVELQSWNDQIMNIALFKGEYHWHHHNKDECFWVIKGCIEIQLQDQESIMLEEGCIATVPAGMVHCPKSDLGAYVVMIEPSDMLNITHNEKN